MAWLPLGGGAGDGWGARLRDTVNRAATSAQRLAEQAELQQLSEQFAESVQSAAEKGAAALRVEQAELQQLGSELRASTQSLVEQGGAALQGAADLVADEASALGILAGLPVEGPGGAAGAERALVDGATGLSPSGLARLFGTEVRAFEAPDRAGGELQVLQSWEVRLGGSGGGGHKAALAALRALLRSRALQTACDLLARTCPGRRVLRAAAGAPVAEADDDASEKTAETGRLLLAVLTLASPASPALLQQLVNLLADVAEQSERCPAPGAKGEPSVPGQDVRWVLQLLSASLTDASEVDLRESGRLQEHADRMVAAARAADAAAEAPSNLGGLEAVQQQLGAAELRARGFRDLRALCAELAAAARQPPPGHPPPMGVANGGGPVPESSALGNTAQSLAMLRAESRRRAEACARASADSVDESRGCEEKLSTSSESFEAELTNLQEQRESLAARMAVLNEERKELMAKLEVVEDELRTAAAASAEVAECEKRLHSSAARVAGELRREQSTDEEAGLGFAAWQRLLVEAGAASSDVEDLLARRAEALLTSQDGAGDAPGGGDGLAARRTAAARACLDCECGRARLLEEVARSLHTAAWGPGAGELAADPERLAGLRGLHMRACAVAEQGWRESVQLAAEELGGGAIHGASSEDFSRGAEKYKEIRGQLQANLDRLTKLEPPSAARAAGAAAPLRAEGAASVLDALFANPGSPSRASPTDRSSSRPGSGSPGAAPPAATSPQAASSEDKPVSTTDVLAEPTAETTFDFAPVARPSPTTASETAAPLPPQACEKLLVGGAAPGAQPSPPQASVTEQSAPAEALPVVGVPVGSELTSVLAAGPKPTTVPNMQAAGTSVAATEEEDDAAE